VKRLILSLVLLAGQAHGTRIKDLASIRGARNNQLSGYGIVVGLSNTGDKGFPLTDNSLGLVVKGLGVEQRIPKTESRNAAAVMVTAMLPAFSRVGSQIDVTVSSIGTATSLDGGSLMMTSLKAPDGKVYAMAQGKLITTKRSERLRGGPTGQSLVTATIAGGAIVEKEVAFDMTQQHEIEYQLLTADFTTSARIARAINEELGGKYATPKDAGSVHVIFP
jgi:flagellar P-ring protein FlgI